MPDYEARRLSLIVAINQLLRKDSTSMFYRKRFAFIKERLMDEQARLILRPPSFSFLRAVDLMESYDKENWQSKS